MPVYALDDQVPAIDPEAFVHPDAVIIGNVESARVLRCGRARCCVAITG